MTTTELCAILVSQYGCRLLSGVAASVGSDIDIYVPATQMPALRVLLTEKGYTLTQQSPGQLVFRRFENNGDLYILDLMSDFRCYEHFAPALALTAKGHESVGASPTLHKAYKALMTAQETKLQNCLDTNPDELTGFLAEPQNFALHKPALAQNRTAKGLTTALHGGSLQRWLHLQKLRLRHMEQRHGEGRTVAFIGPDGSGKSFFINKLALIGETKTVYMGDWFFVLQPLYNALMKFPSPFNRIVYVFYLIENFLRLVKVYTLRGMGKIVLLDRYPGTNRNIAQNGLLKKLNDLTFRLFPKPDLMVLLMAKPETVYARKQELTVEQIAQMQTGLQKLIAPHPHLVLDTEQLDSALNRLLARIMQ